MNTDRIAVRKAEEKDYGFILSLNEANVEVLSPMDEERIGYFADAAELFLVAEADGEPAAFLIALRENVPDYCSENYLWFRKHYDRFLYIDRIVIDEKYRHLGIGKLMYNSVFEHAKNTGVHSVTAEIDTIPYNGTSLLFHKAMGFDEVGEQFVRNGTVRVSLEEAKV